jgi:glycosyltransferase involved in cell wall biosynthesis
MSATAARRTVAYLVNQYPKVSHTFIRREIQALERQGVVVHRFALRGWDAEVADEADREERLRTSYALQGGALPIAGATMRALLRAPRRFFRALRLALRMAHGADRPWPYHLVYLAEACRLSAWIERSHSTHLHAHFGTNSAEVAMLIRELGGPPYSFTVHGPEEFDRPLSLGLREKIRRSAFVVAVSSFGRSQLLRWTDVLEWHKVHVVHCGLESSFHSEAGDTAPAGRRLVCVGRLCEQKGQLLLLRAAGELVRRGTSFELVLAGDGELRSQLEREIDALALRDRVRITGWIDSHQVRAEILAARALVLPSFAEGLPVVIMEAMALGRPVISTYVAGIPELVRDGRDGWLVPAGDFEALVDAMTVALREPADVLVRMGEQARLRVLARHSVDVEAAKLGALFAAATPAVLA